MSEIRWKLAEYLKLRGFTADKLVAVVGDAVEPEIIYRLVEKPKEQRHIELSTLAAILEGLIKLTGIPVNVAEIMEFVPHLSEEFLENSPWRDIFLGEDSEPYDWGDEDPLTIGKPVRYIPGVGAVIVEDEGVAPPRD
ncbi:hypothetical protein [Coleofasciculus sp. H7-2]|uniref:hypothetical protein n=1 Tax=Coleofasciculus sp. H7-2 TaxID=3351545 RepID=UPI0036721CCB